MIHNKGQNSATRRRRVGNLEHLERRELLSTTSLQKYGAELGQVNLRIAELSKVSAAVPSAQKVQGKLAALSQQKLTLKSAIHAVQVRRIDAQMQRRFQAEAKRSHGNAMTPADEVTITDFAPIASELPNTEGATFYSPQQIQTAYGLNTEYNALNLASEGKGVTIAIVDAYYDQYITSDLKTFSSVWGCRHWMAWGTIPRLRCTTCRPPTPRISGPRRSTACPHRLTPPLLLVGTVSKRWTSSGPIPLRLTQIFCSSRR